ncbi:porin [Candidatus Pelagibacter sp.]|nr:porin [Candidatus Pelagibacter sp.]
MNNIKKIGISALAGSLAMFSVNADVVVSGSSEFTYASGSGSSGAGNGASLTGNPYGMSHDINITGTGELDNGFTYSVNTNLAGQDMAADSSIMTMDMGDLGVIGFDQGSGKFGISTLENNVPTAYEEADHTVGTLGHGIDAVGNTNVLGYSNTFAGVGISLQYNPDISAQAAQGTQAGSNSAGGDTGTNWNTAITSAVPGVDGLTVAVGYSETENLGLITDNDEVTGSVNYTMGSVSVGYQRSSVNNNGTAGGEITAYGIAFNVNENLSVSYSINDNELTSVAAAHVTEESKGYQAAYSMGSASVRLALNSADNVGGVQGVNSDNTELSLALAF